MTDLANQTTVNTNLPAKAQAAKAEIIPPGQELDTQTKKLIKAHKEVLKAMVNGCEAAMEAGEALNEIKDKKLVPHGEFEDYSGRPVRYFAEDGAAVYGTGEAKNAYRTTAYRETVKPGRFEPVRGHEDDRNVAAEAGQAAGNGGDTGD
jgi:hypothetical protein